MSSLAEASISIDLHSHYGALRWKLSFMSLGNKKHDFRNGKRCAVAVSALAFTVTTVSSYFCHYPPAHPLSEHAVVAHCLITVESQRQSLGGRCHQVSQGVLHARLKYSPASPSNMESSLHALWQISKLHAGLSFRWSRHVCNSQA